MFALPRFGVQQHFVNMKFFNKVTFMTLISHNPKIINNTVYIRCSWCISRARQLTRIAQPVFTRLPYCTATIPMPTPEGQEKTYDPKVTEIVNSISTLTLIQVADLNELLKKTLNITDAPVMMGGGGAMAAPVAAKEEEEEIVAEKASFNVVLKAFAADKKVALIKQIKSTVAGMNLVQAKKFVESLPQKVEGDMPKEDAEKLKKALEAVGGTVDIE